MARKINPNSFRLGIIKDWDSRWINTKHAGKWLAQDESIRELIMKRIGLAGIARIEIERTPDKYKIFIKASKPGIIIGRGGKGIETLTKELEKSLNDKKIHLMLNIEELKRTEISSAVVSQNAAWDLEKRMKFRRTMKRHIEQTMQNREVKGTKMMMSGRLDGNEIARTEQIHKGKLPLSTLRANIDYGTATAVTTYGTIGIKVWIYKGDVFNKVQN